MTSIEEFICVFCQESFCNKEDLQIHFRKHGDPSFNTHPKNKCRPQSEMQPSNEQKNDEVDTVSCDVCTEVFPTISKAITHKHKVHPDHDAKYFCPWCGKLFTMKHLYNKHIQCSHGNAERNDSINFHCDMCSVDFYIAAAMMYHNKFFHRQDTDLPTVGQSKKLKKVNQELLQIYYCAFCGDEYDNKVNIYKHMTEEHNDENQSPEDILRCPLCEAIFYHLDAYEIHLTFHSTEDLYSENNEMFEHITDFSLETVAPVIEKNTEDVVTTLNAVGIERFLEMAMDNSLDNDNDNDLPKKTKKRKKHKKSKKSAITLDEFLNMNKDVFGEGIDIQGVEEVPTQMVAKRLTTRKVGRPPKNSNNTDLEKLKKQGIVVKIKPSKKAPKQTIKFKGQLGETALNVPKTCVINNHATETKTPNDVISKLMNQSNSQIKIVKKKSNDNSNIDQQIPENILKNSAVTASGHTSPETENLHEFHDSNLTDAVLSPIQDHKTIESSLKNNEQQVKQLQLSDKKNTLKLESKSTDEIILSNKSKNYKTVSSKKVDDVNAHSSMNQSKENSISAEFNSEPLNHAHNSDEELSAQEPDNEFTDQESHPNIIENDSKNNSLAALKHLSHLITIKPVSPKGSLPVDPTKHDENKIVTAAIQPESSHKNLPQTVCFPPTSKEEPHKSLKSLNKNITVKSTVNEEHNLSDEVTNQNLVTKKQINTQSKNIKNEQYKIISNKEESQSTNVNILKRLTNITAKPINTVKNHQQNLTNNRQNMLFKKPAPNKIKESPINENIEIFNIDDSDSDEAGNNSVPSITSSTIVATKSDPPLDKLQSLNKSITIKTFNKETIVVNKNKPNIKEEIVNKSEFSMSDFSDEGENQNTVVSNSNLSSQAKIQNTLKNLSKNITVKSRNIAPIMPMKVNKNIFSQNENVPSYEYSDDDSIPSDVNITELDDGNLSGDESSQLNNKNNEFDSNVTVQSPEESNGDDDDNCNDDTDGELSDLEKQLTVSTIKRPIQMTPSVNIKNINKNITIKKVAKEQTPVDTSGRKCSILPNHKEISIKPFKQVKSEASEQPPVGKKTDLEHANIHSIDHNETSNIQMGTVNKEVMVKTYQTQTVIQEITTTVTKTIKTVNQAVKQQLQTVNSQPLRFQKVQGMSPNNCIQSVPVRQRAPTAGTKVRGLMPSRPPQGNSVRPCNQLVPVRPCNQVPVRPAMSNTIRTPVPRMPSVKKIVPTVSNQQMIIEGKPLKMSPSAIVVKRPSEEAVGHFSCFKKPKESLIPISDIPDTMEDDDNYDSSNNYIASQSTSNFSSVTKTIKGNTVVNSTQMKSETSCSSLSKLNSISGLKIVKTSKQSVQVEEKCELGTSKRNTIEAIEKLQKQGLLIKKPRIESTNENDLSEEDE